MSKSEDDHKQRMDAVEKVETSIHKQLLVQALEAWVIFAGLLVVLFVIAVLKFSPTAVTLNGFSHEAVVGTSKTDGNPQELSKVESGINPPPAGGIGDVEQRNLGGIVAEQARLAREEWAARHRKPASVNASPSPGPGPSFETSLVH
ncbi:MAG: hypothetical protein H7222_12920 [Methylotenera sp.]|nr:hypothetical protein [Oligoflexia bacterium]